MFKDVFVFGYRLSWYDIFNAVGGLSLLFFNLCQRGKPINRNGMIDDNEKNITSNYILITIVSCVQFFSGRYMVSFIGRIFTHGFYNYFGFAIFAPIIFVIFCKLISLDCWGYLDAFTPGYAISLVFFKMACFSYGCCEGINRFFTLYYPERNQYQFPIQLLECLVAVCIFFFLLYYRKKAKRGTMYPIFLVLYSGTRFFTEFLRVEPNIFGPLKAYHIWCVIGVVVGLVEYRSILKLNRN